MSHDPNCRETVNAAHVNLNSSAVFRSLSNLIMKINVWNGKCYVILLENTKSRMFYQSKTIIYRAYLLYK